MANNIDHATRITEWRKLCRKVRRQRIDPRTPIERALDIDQR